MAEGSTSRRRTPGRSDQRVSNIQRMKAAMRAEMRAAQQADAGQELVDNREGKRRLGTGVVCDDRMLLHRCTWDPNHIECPERLSSIWSRCKEMGLISRCKRIESREARDDEVLLYHTQEFLDVIEKSRTQTEEERESVCEHYDSVYLCEETATAARLASGAAVDLVTAVLDGEIHNGLGLIRPPGHHAMTNQLNGFCGYNNVVIAAKTALDRGLKRILILDFDLHHGQGVQQAFYSDPRVLYMSVHRYEEGRYWPHLRESNFDHVGEGPGLGFNVNVPLNVVGCDTSDYLAIFHRIFLPVAVEYSPQLVLVSAGYDAAIGCPEGCMRVTPAGYSHMIWSLNSLAGGRLVLLLEGGYCIPSLAESAALSLRALLGDACPMIPPSSCTNTSVLKSMVGTMSALRPYWKCFSFYPTVTLEDVKDVEQKDRVLDGLPNLKFSPPPDFPPEKFPTRDYYLVFDDEVKKSLELEIAQLVMSTRLREPCPVRLAVAYDEAMTKHEDDEPHPECPDRIVRIFQRIQEAGYFDLPNVRLLPKGRKLTQEEALFVHDQDHWDEVLRLTDMDPVERDNLAESYNSIFLNQWSCESALLAAGGLLNTVDAVMEDCMAGIAIIRPPGHHAEMGYPHGFCLFNNVGIAARYALSVHGVSRVLILDWDVHHGNGIQNMFYSSPEVLYISIHRYDRGSFFPCTEDAGPDKIGAGAGKGFNVNVAWNHRGCGDLEYMLAFQNIVMPLAHQFSPELVLVSAGFDAARGDPLGGYKVSPEMYGYMTQQLCGLADGRVVLALEGGYSLPAISESMLMCCRAVMGDPLSPVSLGGKDLREEAAESIRDVVGYLKDYWSCLSWSDAHLLESVSSLSEMHLLRSETSEDLASCMSSLDLNISVPRSDLAKKEEEGKASEGPTGDAE